MGLYQIKTLKIESIAPNKIVEMYYQITTKYIRNYSDFISIDAQNPHNRGMKTNCVFLFIC